MPVCPPTYRPKGAPAKAVRDKEHDQKREPWRKWYSLALWKNLRLGQLRREPLCATCLLEYEEIRGAEVVHHIDPHRGDWAKFTDPENLESVCKSCHDGEIQRGERAGWSDRGWYIDGHRIPPRVVQPLGLGCSAVPLTMVCGPPGAGKNTYINQRKGVDDVVIDLDDILADISGEVVRTRERRDAYFLEAFTERNRRLAALADERRSIGAWFVIGAPNPAIRALWAEQLKPVSIIVMETPAHVCRARIRAEPIRAPTASSMLDGVSTWWDRYERAEIDTKHVVFDKNRTPGGVFQSLEPFA